MRGNSTTFLCTKSITLSVQNFGLNQHFCFLHIQTKQNSLSGKQARNQRMEMTGVEPVSKYRLDKVGISLAHLIMTLVANSFDIFMSIFS